MITVPLKASKFPQYEKPCQNDDGYRSYSERSIFRPHRRINNWSHATILHQVQYGRYRPYCTRCNVVDCVRFSKAPPRCLIRMPSPSFGARHSERGRESTLPEAPGTRKVGAPQGLTRRGGPFRRPGCRIGAKMGRSCRSPTRSWSPSSPCSS